MKIALLKSLLCRKGGAEKYAWRLAHAFKQQGHSVTLLTSGPPVGGETEIEILYQKNSAGMSFQAVERFDRFCARTTAQLGAPVIFSLDRNRFQTHLRASNGVHRAYLQRRGSKEGLFKRLSFGLNPLHRKLLEIEKIAFEHPELRQLFVNSRMVKQEILEHYKTPADKIHVVHNGVEWEEMNDDFVRWPEQRQGMAKVLGMPSSTFHFLFVGNNYQRKGLEELLRGLSLLLPAEVHLSVIGKEKDVEHFTSYAQKLQLGQKVSFIGPKSSIRPFYALADALVVPSLYDPFANVTLEALAMGVYVVSSKSNGGHEILTPETGVVIEDLFDAEAMAAALRQAMKSPKTTESAQRIRSSVQSFCFSHQLQQLTQLL